MFRSLVAFSLITGALAAGDQPPEGPNKVSPITCVTVLGRHPETYSKDAFVEYGVSLAAHLCGYEGYAGVELVVEDIVTAVATAVAVQYRSGCPLGTDVYSRDEAFAHVTAAAEALADAIGRGWTSVETCYYCKQATDVLIQSSKDLFVKAIADSKPELEEYGAAEGRAMYEHIPAVLEKIKQVEPVLVKIIAEVKAIIEGPTCPRDGVIDKAPPKLPASCSPSCCDITTGALSKAVDINTIAEAAAGADAVKYTCGDAQSDADAHAWVSTIAEAYAKALLLLSIDCEATGYQGNVCHWVDAQISAYAKDQASAFATAWATVARGCNCQINVDVTTKAFAKVFVEAHAKICVHDFLLPFQGIKQATVEAIADTVAIVWQQDSCVGVPTETNEVCKHCVDRNQRCAKDEDTGESVKGCCDPADVCVRRTRGSAVCKRAGSKAVQQYADRGYGQILTCPKLNEH